MTISIGAEIGEVVTRTHGGGLEASWTVQWHASCQAPACRLSRSGAAEVARRGVRPRAHRRREARLATLENALAIRAERYGLLAGRMRIDAAAPAFHNFRARNRGDPSRDDFPEHDMITAGSDAGVICVAGPERKVRRKATDSDDQFSTRAQGDRRSTDLWPCPRRLAPISVRPTREFRIPVQSLDRRHARVVPLVARRAASYCQWCHTIVAARIPPISD